MAKKEPGPPKKGLTNVIREYNIARLGMDMDSSQAQLAKGNLSYALNAVVENFDANSVNYQNEPGNIQCLTFPDNYVLIGRYFINEQAKHIFFLVNPLTGNSQIGYMINNNCEYVAIVSDPCLGFSINFPIHKIVHRITNCTTEIYWADNVARRWLDIDNVPYKLLSGTAICDPVYSTILDCNQLKIQPNFSIPGLMVTDVNTGGNLFSGAYQFAIQYSDASGSPLTAYYSVTNPCPMNDPFTVSVNFNTPVGKSIVVSINNLDISGIYGYFNLVVIKTINNITDSELIGTFTITGPEREITYTGASSDLIKISMNEIFEKFPYYEQADDLTAVRDILVWKGLTTIDRINYQSIANQITLQWETYRIPATENYRDEINAVNFRGYLRDEVYPFELVFLLTNGRQTDKFHIPGRVQTPAEAGASYIPASDPDYIGDPDDFTVPRWQTYNTATLIGDSPGKSNAPDYKGPWKYGEFAFIESSELYPCNEDVWGDLAGLPIRHHHFPDVLVSPIDESTLYTGEANMVMEDNAIFPIGVKMSMTQIRDLITASKIPQDQKDEIVGVKIVRGDRGTNKSIIGKGILRNVGEYSREGQDFFFPNYPYNDLTEDPFINQTNNAWEDECEQYIVTIISINGPGGIATLKSASCATNKDVETEYNSTGTYEICSVGFPTIIGADAEITASKYEIWKFESTGECAGYRVEWVNAQGEIETQWVAGWLGSPRLFYKEVLLGTTPFCVDNCDKCGIRINFDHIVDLGFDCPPAKPVTPTEDLEPYRQIFNSPETSFGQPFLGGTLKLESILFGKGKAHFVEVKDNAKYKLLSFEAQEDALDSAYDLANITDPFNIQSLFTAYEAYIEIYVRTISRRNFGYNYNSIASYNYSAGIPNDTGIKQRSLDIFRYLIPGVQAVGEGDTINNFQRESSVYLKTSSSKTPLPFPKDTPSLPGGFEDRSRQTISGGGLCQNHLDDIDITVASYYASLKNLVPNQWGQIYSYRTVDTAFQKMLTDEGSPGVLINDVTIFGGDTFINKFAFKTKLPFFIDNRVKGLDDSDIFYDEIGNVAYPTYWHSARSIHRDATIAVEDIGVLPNFFSYKAHNFDCPNDQIVVDPNPPDSNPDRLFYDGYFYMFAYGIPSFYCESSYNVDLRQAFNNREGDYWPHVSSSIPDDWMQEGFVSIVNDNTYTYNVSYSKQNKENSYTSLPPDWSIKLCTTHFPFRAVYSDVQSDDQSTNRNNWLIYRAVSYFDFPQNFGKFISIDGIADSAVLARFENKTLIYNSLITIDTSNPQAAYIGNPNLFSGAPPIDFADTDLGFVGTQNKMLLKIPNGQISVDAKRGHIFLMKGGAGNVDVISRYGSGMNSFLKEHLPFKMLQFYPENKITENGQVLTIPGINVDNNFRGVGLHGVYDSRFERVIITKLDYEPLFPEIKLNPYTQTFSYEGALVNLTDERYFCNKSWTLSYNLNTSSWVSFHSYIPNFYIAENNHFYSGLFDTPSMLRTTKASIWGHLKDHTIYNSYYGVINPFVIEYPFSYESGQDEILQGVSTYNKVYKYFNDGLVISDKNNKIQTDDDWFNKSIIYNGQQCSGILELVPKPINNMKEYMSYPKLNVDSKTILWTKTDNMYNYNTFWDTVINKGQPLFETSCESLSIDKVLNQDNMDYSAKSFNKSTMRAKDIKIRQILDNRSDIAIITQFILSPSQISYL